MKKFLLLISILCLALTGCSEVNDEKIENITNIAENINDEIEEIKVEENITEEEKLVEEVKSGEKEEEILIEEVPLIEEEIITEVVPASASNLSNTKCAWGFVRKKDGNRPEFYGPHSKVLDDYEGIYCGNSEEKVIYLTFDEGYENGYTASILDTLKEKEVPAVFFVTMPYVKQNPDLIRRMVDEGHIVGNHIPV